LLEQMAALDANSAAGRVTGKALCVQIAFNAKVTAALGGLADAMAAAGAQVTTVGISEQTIWDRVGNIEAAELIDRTVEWIENATAGVQSPGPDRT
jgi:hypothetical protein